MSSLKLIKKSKQSIKLLSFQGGDNNSSSHDISGYQAGSLIKSAITKPYSDESSNVENEDSQEIKEKILKLKELQKELIELFIKLQFNQKIIEKNNSVERFNQEKLYFPFQLISYDKNSEIEIKSKDDSSRYIILSNSDFGYISEYDIMKRFVYNEIKDKIYSIEHKFPKEIPFEKSLNEEKKQEEISNNDYFNDIFENNNEHYGELLSYIPDYVTISDKN